MKDLQATNVEAVLDKVEPKKESSKCSKFKSNDVNDLNRVAKCSLLDSCLNSMNMDWDSSLCIDSESCSFWITTPSNSSDPQYHSGCIMTDYCGISA